MPILYLLVGQKFHSGFSVRCRGKTYTIFGPPSTYLGYGFALNLLSSSGASQVALEVKNPPASAGDLRCRFDPWVGKIPCRRAWQPTPVFLRGESHGQRSLAGCSPRGCEGSDAPEHTHLLPAVLPWHSRGLVACTSKPFQSLLSIRLQSRFHMLSVCYSNTPLLSTKIYIRLDSLPEQSTGSEPSARDYMKPEFHPHRLCLQVQPVTLRASTHAFGRGHKHLIHNNHL